MTFSWIKPIKVIIGCAYSLLASSLWPSVAYVVPEKAIGSAFGVMQSIQNLGLAVLFILIGLLVDYKGYLILELVFITMLSCDVFLDIGNHFCLTIILRSCLVALAISILLYIIDGSYGGILFSSNFSIHCEIINRVKLQAGYWPWTRTIEKPEWWRVPVEKWFSVRSRYYVLFIVLYRFIQLKWYWLIFICNFRSCVTFVSLIYYRIKIIYVLQFLVCEWRSSNLKFLTNFRYFRVKLQLILYIIICNILWSFWNVY